MNAERKEGLAGRTGSAKCCELELRKCGKAGSIWNKEGESWVCPKCDTLWMYLEDEAEGGAWHRNNVWGGGSPNSGISNSPTVPKSPE